MTRFETCIPRILKHEGGFVDHPSDPGGATNKGITIATYRRYINPKGTVADLKKLTQAQAVKVYKGEYWDKVSADKLPVGVDYVVADFGVNSGPSRAVKHLQRAVGVTEDGVLGPQTMMAVKKLPPAVIVQRITDSRMQFLRGLKTWGTFGKGWTIRVQSVRRDALDDMGDNDTLHGAPVGAPKPDHVPTVKPPSESGLVALIKAFLKWLGGRK